MTLGPHTKLLLLLLCFVGFTMLWTRVLVGGPRRSGQVAVVWLSGWVSLGPREILAVMKSSSYYGLALVGVAALSTMFKPEIAQLFTIGPGLILPSLLGVIAEFGTIRLVTAIYCAARVNTNLPDEIRRVVWINGIYDLPRRLRPFAPVAGAFVEEFLFRGALLAVLSQSLALSPPVAVLIVTGLFLLEQILLCQTVTQRIVIGTASIVISAVGCLLVLWTGSLWPAVISHASFVIFYVGRRSLM